VNNQEVFDTVARHLLTQQVRSVGEDRDGCRYRGHNGRKCAIGALIPDELYLPEMEGKYAHQLTDHYQPLAELLAGVDTELLGMLQSIHDVTPVDQWSRELIRTATKFHLSDDVVHKMSEPCTAP
jgi:hypothetical protein